MSLSRDHKKHRKMRVCMYEILNPYGSIQDHKFALDVTVLLRPYLRLLEF